MVARITTENISRLRSFPFQWRGEIPRWFELTAVALLFLLSNIAGILFQRQIPDFGGLGKDGVHYYNMAQELVNNQPIVDAGPFVYRIATPFLVARLAPDNLIFGFKLVNLIAGALAAALFWIWARLHISSGWLRLLLSALFITQWIAPIRYVYYIPVLVDSWFYPVALAGLIIIHSLERSPRLSAILGLSLLSFVGVLFREVALMLPVALLGSKLLKMLLARKQPAQAQSPLNPLFFVLPLIAGLAGLLLTHLVTTAQGSYSFSTAAITWATHKNPLSYAYSWAVVFGPILILPLFSLRRVITWLGSNIAAGLYLLMVVVLALIGGANTERFAYWAMPVVYVLAGIGLESESRIWKAPLLLPLLAVAQLFVQFHMPG